MLAEGQCEFSEDWKGESCQSRKKVAGIREWSSEKLWWKIDYSGGRHTLKKTDHHRWKGYRMGPNKSCSNKLEPSGIKVQHHQWDTCKHTILAILRRIAPVMVRVLSKQKKSVIHSHIRNLKFHVLMSASQTNAAGYLQNKRKSDVWRGDASLWLRASKC